MLQLIIHRWLTLLHSATLGSSRPEVFCKEDVLRNFAKFTGKHLCQSLFFEKVADFGFSGLGQDGASNKKQGTLCVVRIVIICSTLASEAHI